IALIRSVLSRRFVVDESKEEIAQTAPSCCALTADLELSAPSHDQPREEAVEAPSREPADCRLVSEVVSGNTSDPCPGRDPRSAAVPRLASQSDSTAGFSQPALTGLDLGSTRDPLVVSLTSLTSAEKVSRPTRLDPPKSFKASFLFRCCFDPLWSPGDRRHRRPAMIPRPCSATDRINTVGARGLVAIALRHHAADLIFTGGGLVVHVTTPQGVLWAVPSVRSDTLSVSS
ncbi:hypothetical protein THAOC_01664, partial [Thalassiosira oceanica]